MRLTVRQQWNANPSHSGTVGWVSHVRSALWYLGIRLRQDWRPLLGIAPILICANCVVCLIPLFSAVASQSLLTETFSANSPRWGRTVTINAEATAPTASQTMTFTNNVSQQVRHTYGTMVNTPPEFTVESPTLALYLTAQDAQSQTDPMEINLIGAAPDVIRRHISLRQGSWPKRRTDQLFPIVINVATANALHLQIDSRLFFSNASVGSASSGGLSVVVVGIATAQSNDPVLGEIFTPRTTRAAVSSFAVIGDADATFALGGRLAKAHAFANPNDPADSLPWFNAWTFELNTQQVRLDEIPSFLDRGAQLAAQLPLMDVSQENFSREYVAEDHFFDSLNGIETQLALNQGPIISQIAELLSCTILAIVILAVYAGTWSLDSTSTLLSRGLDRTFLFLGTVVSSLLVGLVVFPLGLSCAVAIVTVFGATLIPNAQTSTNLAALVTQAASVFGYSVIGSAILVGAMLASSATAARLNSNELRREQGRESRRPLWRLLYVDVICLVVGGAGILVNRDISTAIGASAVSYSASQYLMTIAAPICFVLGAWLLFARCFPFLLRVCLWLARGFRGATPFIAIARIARSPRQATSLVIMLALATCLSQLTTIAESTHQARAADVATRVIGADFTGTVTDTIDASVTSLEDRYRTVPGIVAASAGTQFTGSVTNGEAVSHLDILAMDADTFGDTAYWSGDTRAAQVSSFMRELAENRGQRSSTDSTLPAVVDDAAWNALGLGTGCEFRLDVPDLGNSSMTFCAIARVPDLPSILPANSRDDRSTFAAGGVLVDFQALVNAMRSTSQAYTLRPDWMWLRTTPSGKATSSARDALTNGPLALTNLQDRAALIRTYEQDPIQVDVFLAQQIVAYTAIALVVILMLFDAWFAARRRQRDAALFQALGIGSAQTKAIQLVEQSVKLGVGSLLGIAGAWLLAPVTVSALSIVHIMTGVNETLTAVDSPPTHMVVPWTTLALTQAGVAALIVVGTIALTGSTVQTPAHEALRVNQD